MISLETGALILLGLAWLALLGWSCWKGRQERQHQELLTRMREVLVDARRHL